MALGESHGQSTPFISIRIISSPNNAQRLGNLAEKPSGKGASRRTPSRRSRSPRRWTDPFHQPEHHENQPMFVQLNKDLLGRKAGERLDVGDAEAQQLIRSGAAVAVSEDPITPAVNRALDGAFARYAQNLDAALNRALKEFADAQGQARKIAVPTLFGPGGDGDPRGKTFGDWA